MKIAIHQNKEIFCHTTTWDNEWIDFCQKNDMDYTIVNCFDNDILKTIRNYDILLWHFSNYSMQEMLFARSILTSIKSLGVKVFPDYETVWHFDDKVAETYLLKSNGSPIPLSYVFYTYKSAVNYLVNECSYPIVAKLRCGSGSSNVKLLKSRNKAIRYTKKMFSSGYNTAPNILFKTKSNIKSAKNWTTIVKRFKRIPDFLETLNNARKFPKEKGYIFLQEYIPNDGFDLKVVVVGDKLSFLARDVRKGDFRASGGGSIKYDKTLISSEIREVAFSISEKCGFQSMGYDFVIDKRDNSAKIVEISYGFSHTAQMELGGYWDKEGKWYDEPLNAPIEIIKNMINHS